MLVLCLGIPLLATLYIVQFINKNVFFEQKGDNLIALAHVLDKRLDERGYDAILKDAGAERATREQKIATLNAALRDATDEVASVSERLGVGFYSRELDAILTYGPSDAFGENVGKPIGQDHPGRTVMATGTPMVRMGTMVRGNIMNAMIPVERGGDVIGYIWANELVSDLESTLNRSTGTISFLLLLAYLLMVTIVTLFFRRLMRAEKKSRDTVEEASREIQRVDGLMHIVNKAVSSLLSADENGFEEAQQNCMNMMMSAMEVDRLFIWRLDTTCEKDVFRLAAFSEGGIGSPRGHIDFEKEEARRVAEWSDWLESMENNRVVTRFRSEMTEAGGQWLDSYDIKSITIVPVFLQDDFWGFVSFSNCHEERSFTKDEETILVSGSMLMANAIARNEMLHRLVQAREEALAGTRAKSAFLASMSHEMRTPMNAIIGMTAIGKSATDVARKDYAFGKIGDASTHLLGVINDVLDLSKIESGKLELSPVEFVFRDLLRRVESVMGERFAEKELSFSVRIDESIPTTLVCDDQRLAQVITNLLSNAVKFTPSHGAVTLDARLIGEDEEGYVIQIDVSDTGIGLSAEQQGRVFQSFEQAESSTTRKYGGTGLGLSISKNLVEMMGGRIWVESKEGQGATFSFTVRAPAGSHQETAGPDDASNEKPTDDYNGRIVLLAEDVEVNREILLGLLEYTGIAIDCAYDGAQAVQMFRENPGRYEMIFMDVQMPEMDGYEATRRIRAMEAENAGGEKIPIVAMTANVFREDIEACRAAGMDDHIGKPLDLKEVLEKLRRYLR
ncbi:response regulator [Synergistaceae bacterium OttesenSCG-928-I11]|nr:response regulator [Synergistaceae bacterium OttesenSCG-928-I11]